MDEKDHSPEQMPQTIGRYQVQGSIGYGAMGAVYKAFDPLIKRTLAIKTIRLDIPRQSPQYKSFIERFYHEARISGTLSHPNIVTLFDIGEEGGIPYLAMEYVEGETIASLLDKGVRFNPEKVISLVSQIASAVDYAHTKGVIHRDIKPSNLILFEMERVKVTDFGIAKLVDAEMTQSGTLLGTPSYMSPEQAMGDKLDGRSDIFSLGVCAFEMLSGEQPFPGNNVTSILYKLVHVDPIEPANLEMNGLVPQKWHDVFGKVLAKRPDDRYQNASEFVQDLEYCLGSWFGSAMGDDTLSEAVPAVAIAAASAEPVDQEATRALPAMTASAAPAKAAPPPAPPAPAPPKAAPAPAAAAPPPPAPREEELPATVHMKVPAEAPSAGKTVLMSADQGLSTPPTTATEAPVIGVVGATVLMAAPSEAPEATVRAPVPQTAKAEVSPATVKAPIPAETTRPAAKPTPPAPPKPPARPTPPPPMAAAPITATAPSPLPEVARHAARAGVSAGLILGGAAAVFVLAVLTAGVLLMRRHAAQETPAPTASVAPEPSLPAPPPSEAPAPAAGALHVESQPPGANVTVNGEAKGVTPLDLTALPTGTYEVKLELKGYEARTQSVSLTAEALDQKLSVSLARPAPISGVADILSTPFGAAVTLDGSRKLGVTPLTDLKLAPGNHQFALEKEGYEPFTTSAKVEAGKRAKIDAQLKAIVKATPTPADVVDTARIYMNAASDVDTPARKVHGSSASYPEGAPRLRSGESVSVSVSFVVTEDGEVTDLKVVESGGKAVDDGVMAALRNWKYNPAVKKGVKVKVRITFKQTFQAG